MAFVAARRGDLSGNPTRKIHNAYEDAICDAIGLWPGKILGLIACIGVIYGLSFLLTRLAPVERCPNLWRKKQNRKKKMNADEQIAQEVLAMTDQEFEEN